MDPSNNQPDIQLYPEPEPESRHHAYKWVWGISGAILLLAVSLTIIIWLWGNDEAGEVIPEVIPWTAEDKKEALEELHKEAQMQGVQELTAEQKMLILKNGSTGI